MLGFEEYVAARGPALLRLAFLLSGDEHRAQELAQAALAKAFERWGRVAAADRPDAYVRRVLVNGFVDGHRRRRERPVDPADPALEAAAPGDHAELTAARAQMWQALAALPRQQRAVLVLRFYEGYDDTGIAEVLDCGPSTVRSNAARGLAALHNQPAFSGARDADRTVLSEPAAATPKGAQR